MKKIIPIFPLQIVIFPNSIYPLHIFEEHNKKMIDYCLSNKFLFGIFSLNNKTLNKIGTLCKIQQVTKKYLNGDYDILIEGTERILLFKSWSHNDGYLLGEIEKLEDIKVVEDYGLVQLLVDRFKSILDKIHFKLDENFWINFEKSKYKSFKMAEKSGLGLEQQQKFLTIQDENERIHFLLNHFQRIGKFLSEKELFEKFILNDGFLN